MERQDAALLATAGLLIAANVAVGLRHKGAHWTDQPLWVGIVRSGLATAAATSLVRFSDGRRERRRA